MITSEKQGKTQRMVIDQIMACWMRRRTSVWFLTDASWTLALEGMQVQAGSAQLRTKKVEGTQGCRASVACLLNALPMGSCQSRVLRVFKLLTHYSLATGQLDPAHKLPLLAFILGWLCLPLTVLVRYWRSFKLFSIILSPSPSSTHIIIITTTTANYADTPHHHRLPKITNPLPSTPSLHTLEHFFNTSINESG